MKSGFGFLNWNGFLGGEIRYRISRSIRGLQLRNWQLASALQNSSVFEKRSNRNADSNLGLLSS